MNNEQKKYIEKHIDLIKENDWKEFFRDAPVGVGGVLYEAGFDFMTQLGYIPQSAFYESNIKTMNVPDGVTTISTCEFYGCKDLTSVTIPDSVTRIGTWAFSECTSLKNITIGNGVQIIGDEAFRGCTSLTNITIPSSFTRTGNAVFSFCSNLMSVIISDDVIRIDEDAFYKCSSLTNVTIPDSVDWIGDSAFETYGNININYAGTVAKWKQLIINNSRVFRSTKYICTCSDGIVKKSR